MQRRTIAITLGAFVASALIGWFVASAAFGSAGDGAPVADSATTVTTAPESDIAVVPYYIDPYETLVASTAIVPAEAGADDDSFDLRFDMVSLAPSAELTALAEDVGGDNFFVDDGLIPIFLKDWVLDTSIGPIEGSITRPGINVVRFPVEQGFSTTAVQDILVTRYLIGVPMDASFVLSESEPRKDLYPGVSITLRHRSDQDGETIVQVEVASDLPIKTSWMRVRGEGHGWRSSVREAEGGPRWTLMWIGDDLPDEIPLSVVGTAWLDGSEPIHISIEGLR